MNRRITHAIAAALAIAMLPIPAAAAVNPPPEVENITLYATQVPPEGSLTVGADIWDNDGIEMNTFRFEHESGYRLELSLNYTAGYGTAAERYSGKLKIPDDAPEGVYTLVFASATDSEMNRTRMFPSDDPRCDSENASWLESQPSFEVKRGVADPDKEENERKRYNDTTPPTLGSIRLGFTERVTRCTRYELYVEAADSIGGSDSEASGIGHITVRFRNDENGRIVSKVLSANDYSGRIYQGWLEIGNYEPSGSFSLYQVTVVDRAFNSVTYCQPADVGDSTVKQPLPTALSFVLDNGSTVADTVPPVLQSVSVAKDSITAGDTLYVTAKATDDLSGVQSVSLQFRNEGGKTVAVLLTNKGDDTLGGTLQDYQTTTAGNYKLTRATVTDHAGNRSSAYAEPGGNLAELTVSAGFTISERSN